MRSGSRRPISGRVRLVLALRTAGILIIGLMLPGVARFVGAILWDAGVVQLRRGHPDAVLGFVSEIAAAVGNALQMHLIWPPIIMAIGVALVVVRWQRAERIIHFLERR